MPVDGVLQARSQLGTWLRYEATRSLDQCAQQQLNQVQPGDKDASGQKEAGTPSGEASTMVMNSHDYENLGDAHFQMLCQALLARKFPDIQCYPIGMPDGGRDAKAYDSIQKGSIIFQVKFCREPAKLDDPVKWICSAIDQEVDKVNRLAARGAQRYILLTNVPGTSHLDTGSIDRVQAYLDEKLDMPAQCWWRDDLDRRLEGAYDIKLRYPSILRGTDYLRQLLDLAPDRENFHRRRTALYSYLGYCRQQESTVRFKQVELVSTDLLDLYIDVPAIVTSADKRGASSEAREVFKAVFRRIREPRDLELGDGESDYWPEMDVVEARDGTYLVRSRTGAYRIAAIGSANLLTDAQFIDRFPFVMVEGAPGQGKSTLTQYLAQLQRSRLLEHPTADRFLAVHKRAPVAIPFRIELRDLATWLKGIDPWASGTEGSERHNLPRSLEGAIAAHVERHSGGVEFSVTDLNAVLKEMPCVLLLDALDEVADLDDRAAVVDAIRDALARLEGNGVRPQVVVTSRPSAIAGSPTLPPEQFLTLSLAPLDEKLALDYAEKWARARRLDEPDRSALPAALREKLRSPHIAQLATNTMQLTILLSLVQRRGVSLPDKRTELYNAYFEIFLDRESEKSPLIRDNREVLFDIHRFLGFHLHANAEQSKTGGRIHYDELKLLLRDYLSQEGQSHILVDTLLKGIVERFGALVSRVQGQYEFEVQPLREYFAARYLSDTAPPSTPGRERPGTKSERFDVISRNPYWFNVARFLGGCFSKGELADLAERLCDFVCSPEQASRPFARSLCVALLQDWVFSQSPRATRKVVRAVFDDPGLSWAVLGYLDSSQIDSPVVRLPPGGGAEQVIEICWERLGDPRAPGLHPICRLLRANGDPREVAGQWYDQLSNPPGGLERWITVGRLLGVSGVLGSERLVRSLSDLESLSPGSASAFVLASPGRLDALPDRMRLAIFRDWLDSADVYGVANYLPLPREASASDLSVWLTHPVTLLDHAHGRTPHPGRALARLSKKDDFWRAVQDEPFASALSAAVRDSSGLDFTKDLAPWVNLVSVLETHFAGNWRSVELSLLSSMIRNPRVRGRGGRDLFCMSTPLPVRLRYARGKARNAEWWLQQLARAEADDFRIAIWCTAVAIFADVDTLLTVFREFDTALLSLSDFVRYRVVRTVERARGYAVRASRTEVSLSGLEYASPESLVILAHRLQRGIEIGGRLLERMTSRPVAELCLEWLLSTHSNRLPIDHLLEYVARAYEMGAFARYVDARTWPSAELRRDFVSIVLADPLRFPQPVVSAATHVELRRKVSYAAVLTRAASERWFEGDDERY